MSFCGNRREKGDSFRIHEIEVGQYVRNGGESGDLLPRPRNSMKIRELPPWFFQPWRIIFGVSCVLAVAMDPLFFYVPVINEGNKCIELDKKLKTISLVLRSVTDIIGIINIILQVLNGCTDKNSGEDIDPKKIPRWWLYFLIDILVILPFPQVIILFYFRELKGSTFLNTRKLLTFFVLFQYVPRVVQIYRSWKNKRKANTVFNKTPIWVKAAFNFFLYIVASHVLGAFWYFLSIERETACWHRFCVKKECSKRSFNCDHSLGNYAFLNDFCIISPPNTTTPDTTFFDFGIFYGALNSGVVQSKNFSEKFFQCFWWGLRNLSSLGQNLQTSNYVWENFFAALISLVGLLLFSYFIGNLQLYMQLDTASWEKKRKKAKEEKYKRKQQIRKIKIWMFKYKIPGEMKGKIMQEVERKLEEKEDVCVENLLSHLPQLLRNDIKRHLCWNLLKQICDSLNPRYYSAHSYIVREGDPIDATFFIKDGIAWTYTTNKGEASGSSQAESLERDQFFGEELIELVLKTPSLSRLSKLPLSTMTVKTHGKVEAFALMARDLNNILLKNWLDKDKEESKPFAANVIKTAWLRHHEKSSHGGRYLMLSSGTQGN
ncbi:cyclic nucleotide-gated ion channel 1-like isoform X2 [Quercus robur]|uniref:cyclic nucleotide-gated ion channel 1-like isoform X2 n=1 Tax=Quercus robur TaxID=38942 RepID=UPI0021616B5A|nr:cyclic nucleotide-gated ion channel 1-like isoform X2 [Quercus robur]